MISGAKITVRVRIVGPLGGLSVDTSGTIQLKAGDTVKRLFNRADAALGLRGQKPFKQAFRQGIRPVVLLNGDRLEIPEEGGRCLADGDEVSVILTVAGG
ncbi:MAG: MoaD/ThiS family protein [Desulfobacteraceae bacterium]|nr:MoaD/ThiS family protein [Desulfobacteraceae bacterium]